MALTDNLISYWKLDEASGNAADSVGSNTGTNTNVTYAAAKINNGGSFNGTSSILDCTRITEIENIGAFTFSAWIKQTTLDQSRCIWQKNNVGGAGSMGMYSYTDGNMYFEYNGSVNRAYFDYSTVISAGTWANVVMVFNGSGSGNSGRLKVYVNGVEITLTYVGTIQTTTSSSTDNFQIGARPDTSFVWSGMLDEVGIWSRVLTSSEISQLYRNGTGLAYPFTTPTNINENCISLNGTNQYLTAADSASLDITGDMTVELRFNSVDVSAETTRFLSKYTTSGNQSYLFGLTGGYYHCLISADGSTNTQGEIAFADLSDNTWYHIAYVYDASAGSCEVFVDGISKGSITGLANSIFSGSSPVGICSRPGPADLFNGLIDEVRIWNVARTPTEINANKAKRIVSYPGLVASWSLDNTLTDSSGNGNTLTNVGSATFSTDVSALTESIDSLGAISYWKLDETSGNASDSIGSNTLTNNGTMTYAAGKINNGASPTTSKYLSLADIDAISYDGTQSISYSLWFKPTSTTGVQTIFSKWENGTGTPQEYILYLNGTSLVFGALNDGTGITWGTAVTAGNWYYVVLTLGPSKAMQMYVNNGAVQTHTSIGSVENTSAELRFGQNAATNWFTGLIDEVGLWSRALSATEVTRLYNSGNGLTIPVITTPAVAGGNTTNFFQFFN